MMTVLSIIPGLGTAIVWIPGVVYLLASGHVVAGVLLGVYCAVVVGSIDNVLRPRLIGRDVKMHPLLILFGTLGGVVFFGVVGFIVGPVLAALFVTIWDIYGVVFSETLPAERQNTGRSGTDSNG
jgi:predicted PurR-regulated permease PerM